MPTVCGDSPNIVGKTMKSGYRYFLVAFHLMPLRSHGWRRFPDCLWLQRLPWTRCLRRRPPQGLVLCNVMITRMEFRGVDGGNVRAITWRQQLEDILSCREQKLLPPIRIPARTHINHQPPFSQHSGAQRRPFSEAAGRYLIHCTPMAKKARRRPSCTASRAAPIQIQTKPLQPKSHTVTAGQPPLASRPVMQVTSNILENYQSHLATTVKSSTYPGTNS